MAKRKDGDGGTPVPAWAGLVTFAIGWVGGPLLVGYTAFTDDNTIGYLIGSWLIVLPLVATKPLEALRDLIGLR